MLTFLDTSGISVYHREVGRVTLTLWAILLTMRSADRLLMDHINLCFLSTLCNESLSGSFPFAVLVRPSVIKCILCPSALSHAFCTFEMLWWLCRPPSRLSVLRSVCRLKLPRCARPFSALAPGPGRRWPSLCFVICTINIPSFLRKPPKRSDYDEIPFKSVTDPLEGGSSRLSKQTKSIQYSEGVYVWRSEKYKKLLEN